MQEYKNQSFGKDLPDELQNGFVLHGKNYDYVVESKLGQGSFGITYLVKVRMKGDLGAIDTNVLMVVKEFFMNNINSRKDSTVMTGSNQTMFLKYKDKFVKEALNISKLKHPNIVKVVENFQQNNTVYYSMEFIPGESLNALINNAGKLSQQRTLYFAKQICEALECMHSNGMLHLDLKPSNIMLDGDKLVLIDFGLSKQYDDNGDPESSISIGGGTSGYAPIEQMNYKTGEGFPVTMDIYALGGTMFKMLTGKTPPNASSLFNDGFPEEVLDKSDCTPQLRSVIKKCMAPAKRDRYQSVSEVSKALETIPQGNYSKDDDLPTVLDDKYKSKEENAPARILENHSSNSKQLDKVLPKPPLTKIKTDVYTAFIKITFRPPSPYYKGAYTFFICPFFINLASEANLEWDADRLFGFGQKNQETQKILSKFVSKKIDTSQFDSIVAFVESLNYRNITTSPTSSELEFSENEPLFHIALYYEGTGYTPNYANYGTQKIDAKGYGQLVDDPIELNRRLQELIPNFDKLLAQAQEKANSHQSNTPALNTTSNQTQTPADTHSQNPPTPSPYAQPGDVVHVKCNCGTVISFRYQPGYENKKITCPECHIKSQVLALERISRTSLPYLAQSDLKKVEVDPDTVLISISFRPQSPFFDGQYTLIFAENRIWLFSEAQLYWMPLFNIWGCQNQELETKVVSRPINKGVYESLVSFVESLSLTNSITNKRSLEPEYSESPALFNVELYRPLTDTYGLYANYKSQQMGENHFGQLVDNPYDLNQKLKTLIPDFENLLSEAQGKANPHQSNLPSKENKKLENEIKQNVTDTKQRYKKVPEENKKGKLSPITIFLILTAVNLFNFIMGFYIEGLMLYLGFYLLSIIFAEIGLIIYTLTPKKSILNYIGSLIMIVFMVIYCALLFIYH